MPKTLRIAASRSESAVPIVGLSQLGDQVAELDDLVVHADADLLHPLLEQRPYPSKYAVAGVGSR